MCRLRVLTDWLIESVTQSLATCYNFFYVDVPFSFFLKIYVCIARRLG